VAAVFGGVLALELVGLVVFAGEGGWLLLVLGLLGLV